MGSEWRQVQFGELAEVKHGFAFDGQYFIDEPSTDVLVTPGNFAIGGGFKLDKPKYYNGPVPPEFVLKPGDLLVTMTDLSKAADTLGFGAIVPSVSGRRLLHNQRIGRVVIKRNDLVDSKFLHWVLRTTHYRNEILGSATGSTVKHTAPSRIATYKFGLPPLREQRAIAYILDTLEDKIELNRRTNETLEAMVRALFKSWFVEFDPVRAKVEGRTPAGLDAETGKLFPNELVDSELGPIPKGWSATPVYNLATYVNGAAYKAFQPNGDRRGLPIVKIAELKAGVTEQTKFSDVEMPHKYRLRTGDVLFSWSGNPDTSIDTFVWAHGDAWLNQHIFRVEPRASKERSFILATLKYLRPVFAEIARNKQTTGLGHVTAGDMQRLLVVEPDARTLAAWDVVARPLFDAAFRNEQEALTLAAVRDGVLPRLLSGELPVAHSERAVAEVA
jgi:type I restriction enzyme S subunit